MNALVLLSQVSAVCLLSQAVQAQSPLQLHPSRIASYDLIDFSTLGSSPYVVPYGISQNGKITGIQIDPVTSQFHVFIYAGGVFQDLGDLGYSSGADAAAINNGGELAGTGYGAGYHAILYSNGHVTTIGSIDDNLNSYSLAMNNLGHVLGRGQNGDGGWQPFLYMNGQLTPLSVDIARSINDSDQYVGSLGFCWPLGGNKLICTEHAFLHTGGVDVDLGSLGGGTHTPSESFAINSSGQVTGYSTTASGEQHAFLYSGGVLSDLGTFPPYYTRGVSINDSGMIAGQITTWVGAQVGSFLYENGQMVNFSDLIGAAAADWSDLVISQIDNAGRVIGTGVVNGESHGFLAVPVKPVHTH
jgi:probable HAF family extracellular repeat protein